MIPGDVSIKGDKGPPRILFKKGRESLGVSSLKALANGRVTRMGGLRLAVKPCANACIASAPRRPCDARIAGMHPPTRAFSPTRASPTRKGAHVYACI